MAFLKMKSHKKFGYQPRYYKGEGSPFKMEHRFDAFRSTAQPPRGLKNKFFWAIDDLKSGEESKRSNRLILTIALILIFFFLVIIDFDLSIFTSRA